MASPNPEPWLPPCLAAVPRLNFSKISSDSESLIPPPLSPTVMVTCFASAAAVMSIFFPCDGEYFQALPSKLPTAWASAARSPKTTRVWLQFHTKVHLATHADGLERGERVGNDVGHGHHPPIEDRVPVLDLGKLDESADQSVEAFQLLIDHGEAALLLGVIVDSIFSKRVDEHAESRSAVCAARAKPGPGIRSGPPPGSRHA